MLLWVYQTDHKNNIIYFREGFKDWKYTLLLRILTKMALIYFHGGKNKKRGGNLSDKSLSKSENKENP